MKSSHLKWVVIVAGFVLFDQLWFKPFCDRLAKREVE